MKLTKQLLALALGVILALGLALPALAMDDGSLYMPVITRQPKEMTYIPAWFSFNLSIEAAIPEGASGELSYQWFKDGVPIDGATGTSYGARIWWSEISHYTCKVTNSYFDDAPRDTFVVSENGTVYAFGGLFWTIYSIFKGWFDPDTYSSFSRAMANWFFLPIYAFISIFINWYNLIVYTWFA